MAFDAGEILARMKLDKSQFTTGLQSTHTDIKKFDSAIGAIFRGGLMATGIAFATKQLIDFASAGAQLLEVEAGFKRIAKDGNTLIRMTQSAATSLSKSQVEQLANQLDLVGISAERLPQLAKIAEAVADQTGRSTSEVLDSLISGTARASDRMVRMLGINVDFKDGMSESAKQAQFLNEVLSQGADIIARYGNETASAADNIDRAKTVWKDWMDEIEKGVAGPVASYFAFMLKLKDMGVPTNPKEMFSLIRGAFGGGSTPGFDDMGTMDARGGGTPARNRVAQAAADAQLAAKKYFESLLGGPKGMGTKGGPQGGSRSGAMSTWFDINHDEADNPGLTVFEPMKQQIDLVGSSLATLGNGFSDFFETLVTDSANAGAAFGASILSGLSSIASQIGDMFISTGLGMVAITSLNPFAAIAAGLALKAVAGLMRGAARNVAPTASQGPFSRGINSPQGKDLGGGNFTVVVEGDFMGDRVWINRLMERIRKETRERGTPVVVGA